MKVIIQSVNFNADIKLINFIEKRLNKLTQYYDKLIAADVFLKVENTSDKENKIFEVRLEIPGDSLVYKKVCRTFEEGTDVAADSLQRQLKKRKEKLRTYM